MSRPESIEALNSHWWYRLIKVAFIVISAGVFVFGLVFIYSGPSGETDYQSSAIKCDNGNSSTLAQLQYLIGSPSPDKLWDSAFEFTPDVPDQTLNNLNFDFQAFCANVLPLTQAQIDALNGKTTAKLVIAKMTLVASTTGFVPFERNFHLSVATKNFTWGRVLYTLIWIIVAVLTFELIRRTFYYIVVGRFFSRK